MAQLLVQEIFLRAAQSNDVNAILKFENANREYFCKWVPARPSDFFKRDRQIEILRDLEQYPRGHFLILIAPNGDVICRINLTFVETGKQRGVELGYRVAEQWNGRGIATYAVGVALEKAKLMDEISFEQAFASAENMGSTQVLKNWVFQLLTVKLMKSFKIICPYSCSYSESKLFE